MIPSREELEQHYDPKEVELLERIRVATQAIQNEARRSEVGKKLIHGMWPDELERISKTHWIQTKERGMQLLKVNYAQKRFYDDVIVSCRKDKRPIRGIILKARQLGFSTFMQSWMFDQCDTNANRVAMTISYDDASTEELFQKAKTIRDRQFFPRGSKRERRATVEFDAPHSSTFYTRTAGNASAGRGITIHHLHCSEVPMWPDPESVTVSVHQSVPTRPFTSIIWESTAQGAMGLFYDTWNAAEAGESDFVPFFAPWFWDPEYMLPFASKDHLNKFMRSLSLEDEDYQQRFKLTPEQMQWREHKIRNDLSGSYAQFQQEFPACAEEAFLTTGSPVFNPKAVRALQDHAVAPMWSGDIFLTKTDE